MKDLQWEMAERFGWTLDYIDSLPVGKIHELIAIDTGRARARATLRNRK